MRSKPIEAVMIGAGSRGYYAYGPYALQHPDEIRFTAVVEPHDERRRRFAQAHDIPLCARQLAQQQAREPHDPGQVLPRPGHPLPFCP